MFTIIITKQFISGILSGLTYKDSHKVTGKEAAWWRSMRNKKVNNYVVVNVALGK